MVSSSSGPDDGGSSLAIGGLNFYNGATVSFGGVTASSVKWVSSTELDVITPAHADGPVDVVVTNPNGNTGRLASAFRYRHRSSDMGTSSPADMGMSPGPDMASSSPGTGVPPAGALEDEFVGPLPSWTNVKTAFGAKGDGVTDDTAAIQAAFNSIQNNVLYFPAGTYNISSTVVVNLTNYATNAGVIGADPATTILRWTGPAGGGMFQLGGFSLSKIGRITFDGAGKAAFLWYGDSGNVEGTSVRGTQLMFFDDVFQNAGKGLIQGRTGSSSQESEWLILRCQFLNDTLAGASVEAWNAGDFWVFWSTFKNCGYGIANGIWGAQMTFSVYGSNFFGSANADIGTKPHVMTIVDNFSSGSNQFLYDNSVGNNSTQMYVQGNRILDTTNPVAIESGGCGPLTMVDNVIRSKPGATAPVVKIANGCSASTGTSLFSLGNRYTVAGAESVPATAPRLYSMEGTTVAYSSIDATIPTLPGTPPNRGRAITEIKPGATAAQIQTAINNAVALAGRRPVIHLQAGSYAIASTLIIPANVDVQIIGDGFNTNLNWTGASSGAVFKLQSPSKARLQDLYVHASSATDGIYVGSEDSPGSRVQVEMGVDTNVADRGSYGVLVEGLTNTLVNLYGTSIESGDTSVYRVVGTGVPGVPSRVACFGCGEGPPATVSYPGDFYHVSNQGNLIAIESWFEEGSNTGIISNLVNESGSLTLLGGMAAATVAAGNPMFNVDNFQGTFTIGSYYIWPGQLRIANATSASNTLVVGSRADQRSTSADLWAGPYPGAGNEAMIGSFQYSLSDGAHYYADQAQGVSLPLPQAFVDKMFAQARKTFATPNTALPAGVSDVQLSRVMFDGGSRSALHIKAGP